MKGEDVCLAWLEQDPHAMEEPIVIETSEGLDMKMPREDLTVADIADIIGEATPIEVIGLFSQPPDRLQRLIPPRYRRGYPIEFSRLDPWKVGEIFFDRAYVS